jgi:MHS family shikimate/dehydroshikimate transporter-like MFS transporter
MGVATTLIGLLPGYATAGAFAPFALAALRVLQGVGLGGEWGGASLMVLEHAPSHRRGFYGSLVQVGFPLGLVTSYGVFALATSMIPEAAFISWGWRVPFLMSIVLLGVGWYVRARVPESPLFEDIKRRHDIVRNPFFEATVKNYRSFLVAVGLKISEVSWVYILTVFVVVYGTTKLGLPRQLLLNAVFIAALVEVITIPLFGWLSDILGRRSLYFFGTIFTVCFAFPRRIENFILPSSKAAIRSVQQ